MHHYLHKNQIHKEPLNGIDPAQDMRYMGGLREHLPKTYWTFLIATLAIAGIPGLSGFFSKDEILWKAFESGHIVIWAVAALAAGLTAFYMFRLVYMTFYGDFRSASGQAHPHESPPVMTVPLIILAVLSVIGGWVGIPHILGGSNQIEVWFDPVFEHAQRIAAQASEPAAVSGSPELMVMLLSIVIALFGIWLAYTFYRRRTDLPGKIAKGVGPVYDLVFNKYYVDEIYEASVVKPIRATSDFFLWRIFDVKLVDGSVNGIAGLIGSIGSAARKLQTGMVSNYALIFAAAVVVIVVAFVI
jgi:NADH-quinone oxidoreductase subunit L